jgi:hypothetical protein
MIIRLTQQLEDKIGVKAATYIPSHLNPYLDWTGDAFAAGKESYIILTNTPSLYSMLMQGRGVVNEGIFINQALHGLRELMSRDDAGFIYQRLIAPDAKLVRYSRAADKTVLSAMNDIAHQAKHWIEQERLSLLEISGRLNESAALAPNRPSPSEAFRSQHVKEIPERDEAIE